jgi:proteic killer suppression protein
VNRHGIRYATITWDSLAGATRPAVTSERTRTLQVLRVPPANRLEVPKGDRHGQHSIRINQQWRICFRWEDGDAYDVEIVDYHKG